MALSSDAPYFIILLGLMPDDFTYQGKSADTQWVNQTMKNNGLRTSFIFLLLKIAMTCMVERLRPTSFHTQESLDPTNRSLRKSPRKRKDEQSVAGREDDVEN